jgi:hypothetical protein
VRASPFALIVAVVVSACGGSGSPREAEPRVATAPTEAPPAGAGAPDAALADVPGDAQVAPPDAAGPAPRIELTFVGDLMFGGYFDDHYDPQYVERHDPLVEMDPLLASDLAFGNLETTIARTLPNGGGPHDGKGHKRFVTLPERVAVLARHHLRTVTLANNHMFDNGVQGLSETVEILGELGIAHVGAARAEPPRFRVEPIEVRGWRIGFVAATTQMNRVPRPDGPLLPYVRGPALRGELVPLIEQARRDHDLVIVVVHWGAEYEDAPARWQIDAAHGFVDAGADVVIGHHPHVLQGIERYRHGVIAYSLGNFVFPNGKERIRETGVLRLGFASASTRACLDLVAFHPAIQVRRPITHPVVPAPAQRQMIAKRLFALSAARPLVTKWTIEDDRFVAPAACSP